MDTVVFNTNRNYGQIMNSHLFANWDVIYSEFLQFEKDNFKVEHFCGDKGDQPYWCFQPMTIVEKPDYYKTEL